MPEVIVEKEVCSECGVDVRDETVYCYNCGSRVVDGSRQDATDSNGEDRDVSDETKAALDDLAGKLKDGETDHGDKLAKAAQQRRKARVSRRKQRKIVWEPTGDSAQGLIMLLAIFVTIITLVVVFFTVIWK